MNWAALLWLILMVVFLAAEGATVMVISLWFAAGALVSMIASLCGADFGLQVILFFGTSIALLLSLRTLVQKFFTPKLTRTNVDAIIGTQGTVVEDINNLEAVGRVKLGAMEWAARSTDGTPVKAGTHVTVDRVEGVKLFVTPLPAEITSK